MPKKVVKETKLYLVVLNREGNFWGYFRPEFGGGGASTKADALDSARKMIEAEIGALREAGEAIPEPGGFEDPDTQNSHIVYMPFVIFNGSKRISPTHPKTAFS